MNAGDLRKALEGVPDGAEIRVEGEGYISDVSSGWLDIAGEVTGRTTKCDTFVTFRAKFHFPRLR